MRVGIGTVLVSLAFASGCGDDGRTGVQATVTALHRAYLAQDYDALCSRLTRRTQREIGSIGHDDPTTCEADVVRRMPSEVLSERDLKTPHLEEIEVHGDRATAIARIGGGERTLVRLAREGDTWKLASLFGTLSRRQLPPRTSGPDSPSGLRFAVAGASRQARDCPPLNVRSITATGGCELYDRSSFTFATVNVFGDRLYTRCVVDMAINLDRGGRLGVSFFQIIGSRGEFDLCGDISACPNADGEPVPWVGRVEIGSSGGLRAAIANMCLDTCMGRFAGPVVFASTRVERGEMILRAREDGIGRSGLLISGIWRLAPESPGARLVQRSDRS